ncbi:hypothetical protein SNE40_012408 [Patella caerulea]|uniref:PiggyBac transposable element-derived protein domain-containing protein n=1 Tax=Patella caerulea TaxID=87958 RepID=A0AAN8JPV1_PATCE
MHPMEKVEVDRPFIVKEYNNYMGGIDLIDAYVSRYKYHMRSRRWYLYLFWQTVILAVVNSWMLYRRACESVGDKNIKSQRKFQAEIAASLILVNAVRRPGRPSLDSPVPAPKRVCVAPPTDVQKDQYGHWPLKCAKRGRCKLCSINNTDTLGEKCDLRLCFTHDRNCFKRYHN